MAVTPMPTDPGTEGIFMLKWPLPFIGAVTGIRAISSNVGNGSMVACFVGGFKGLRPQKERLSAPAGVEVWEKSFPSYLWVSFFFRSFYHFRHFLNA